MMSGEGQSWISSTMEEEEEPRPPPRISKYPAPFNFPEKPVPQVPDVSLIFNCEREKNKETGGRGGLLSKDEDKDKENKTEKDRAPQPNGLGQPLSPLMISALEMDKERPPPPFNVEEAIKGIKKELMEHKEALKVVSLLEISLRRVEWKLDIFQRQVCQSLKAIQLSLDSGTSGSGCGSGMNVNVTPSSRTLPPSQPHSCPPRSHPSAASSGALRVPAIRPQAVQVGGCGRESWKWKSIPLDSVPVLPSGVLEPSTMFSEPSGIKTLDLQEFNEDTFAGSGPETIGPPPADSDDEEEKPPTATFYKNVLGNVNQLLGGQDKGIVRSRRGRNSSGGLGHGLGRSVKENVPPTSSSESSVKDESNFHSIAKKYVVHEQLQELEKLRKVPSSSPSAFVRPSQRPTETTVYGMTPSNLSFATKEYLERYGLVQPQLRGMNSDDEDN